MSNLIFLAHLTCITQQEEDYINLIPDQQLMTEDWSCMDMPWSSESMVRVETNDCKMTRGVVYVTKNNGSHLHYQLKKINECNWKTSNLLNSTTCKDIKNVTIVQDYTEEK
jgi:hypothetical protein